MVKVAVVILNYNGAGYLRQFLPSVIAHSDESQIIVADNASTDNSLEVLKEEFPSVKTIELSENTGYAGGYNEALKLVEAEYYLLLNSDVEVTSGWLQPLIAFLDQNTDYAACQPKILDFNKKDHFEYAGAAGGFIDWLGYPYCRGRIFDTLERDTGQYNAISDVDWCSGACFLIRSEAFHLSQGFDSSFFAHMEEIDLCWRLRRSGHKLACTHESTVYHVGGGTLSTSNPNKTYLNFRNNLLMICKNVPTRNLFSVLVLRIFLDLVAGLLFWKKEGFAHFKAVLRAYTHFLKTFREVLSKRESSAQNLNSRESIIFQYYALGKKTFTQLNSTK